MHRDLKPQNVWIVRMRNRLHFKVGDFGVANLQSKFASTVLREENQLCMSPERWAKKQCEMGCQDADAWSMGVIAYRMMAMKYPFLSIADVCNPELRCDK